MFAALVALCFGGIAFVLFASALNYRGWRDGQLRWSSRERATTFGRFRQVVYRRSSGGFIDLERWHSTYPRREAIVASVWDAMLGVLATIACVSALTQIGR